MAGRGVGSAPALSEARYNRPGSGLYARLFDGQKGLACKA